MINILHLSQTDIKSDSRILKEMQSLAKANENLDLYGIGVKRDIGTQTKELNDIDIYSISLITKELKFLPNIVIQALVVCELMVKMFFKALKLKPQVIHCHDTPVLPLGVLLKFFTGAKLIYDAHELESDRNEISRLSGKLILFVEKILWRFVDALIVVSPSIEKWYKDNIGEKDSKIILNSPVLEKNISDIDKEYLRNYFSISKDSRIFLYVGGLMPGRGIELITEAFMKPDLKSSLVFLGYGESEKDLKKLSKEYQNIYVHDAVSHEKVVSIAKSADIGLCLIEKVSLSDYYCLPNKLFEYCFSEIPILASKFPDISKTVDKYGLGKCSNLDSQSIYKAIKEFEAIKELPEVHIENLYDLSWDAQEEKLINLYNKLIKVK